MSKKLNLELQNLYFCLILILFFVVYFFILNYTKPKINYKNLFFKLQTMAINYKIYIFLKNLKKKVLNFYFCDNNSTMYPQHFYSNIQNVYINTKYIKYMFIYQKN